MIFGLEFHRPRFAEVEEMTDTYGRFSAQPFEKGYGVTMGNSLRRVLLSSIEGAAITAVKIEGAPHEFTPLPGVKEDVIDIILNLKSIPISMKVPYEKVMRIKEKGPKEIYSKDIEHDGDIEIKDPNILLATLDDDSFLEVEMRVKNGRGYVPASDNYDPDLPVGYIPIDSSHSPVKKVNFTIKPARVGRKTDYEKLILEIWTNGAIPPEQALVRSAQILQEHLSIFFGVSQKEEITLPRKSPEPSAAYAIDFLRKRIDEFNLTARSVNALKSIEVERIYQLVQKSKAELLKAKNFGKKSLTEIESLIESHGLSLGIELPKNLLKELEREEKTEGGNRDEA